MIAELLFGFAVTWCLVGWAVAVRLDAGAACIVLWPIYLLAWAVIRNQGRGR